jgi:plasmid maintenance system antidote protein VapI
MDKAGLSNAAAAKALGINERTIRKYIYGENPVPKTVELALLYVVDQKTAESAAV